MFEPLTLPDLMHLKSRPNSNLIADLVANVLYWRRKAMGDAVTVPIRKVEYKPEPYNQEVA